MTFSLNQGVVVLSSQITHSKLSNIHPLVHMLGTCALPTFYSSLPQTHHERHPTPLQVIRHQSAEGRSERTKEPNENGWRYLNEFSHSQYSLIDSTRNPLPVPAHLRTSSFLTLSIRVIPEPNFSNTSSQEHSLSLSHCFSYPMSLLPTTPLVQLLLHIHTSFTFTP